MQRALICTTVAVLAATAACVSDDVPVLRVTTVEVTGEVELSLLDVEVHLVDQLTRAHLGCVGRNQGMEQVDENDIHYQVDAVFEQPSGGGDITERELQGRALELIVIEDDINQCPEPPDPDDDIIGVAQDLDLAAFQAAPLLVFDRVVALRVEFD